jgi:hypothetical protein
MRSPTLYFNFHRRNSVCAHNHSSRHLDLRQMSREVRLGMSDRVRRILAISNGFSPGPGQSCAFV